MRVIFQGASNPHLGRMLSRVASSMSILGFIDDDPAKWGTSFAGYPVLGGINVLDTLDLSDISFVNLISGSCAARYKTTQALLERGCRLTNLIDPSVDMEGVTAGTGLYIQEGVHIQQSAVIADNVSIHVAAIIAHESTIGHSCFIAHAVSVSGCVDIEDGVYVGTNATILPRVTLGRWSVIGAGSVVTKDVPPYTIVAGNPAKVIREVER